MEPIVFPSFKPRPLEASCVSVCRFFWASAISMRIASPGHRCLFRLGPRMKPSGIDQNLICREEPSPAGHQLEAKPHAEPDTSRQATRPETHMLTSAFHQDCDKGGNTPLLLVPELVQYSCALPTPCSHTITIPFTQPLGNHPNVRVICFL